MTKADRIRKLWTETPLNRDEIAKKVGVPIHYVHTIIWRMANPSYHTEYMRDMRQDDHYYFRELARNRIYRRKKAEARAS